MHQARVRTSLSVLVSALTFFGGALQAQEPDSTNVFWRSWLTSSLEEKRKTIHYYLGELRSYVGDSGVVELRSAFEIEKYPFIGIGIRYSLGTERLDSGRVQAFPQVRAIFRGSPAAEAGLRIGDRLVRVNDSFVCGLDSSAVIVDEQVSDSVREVQVERARVCHGNVGRLIDEAIDTVRVEVERDGERLTLTMKKAAVGVEFARAFEERYPAWRALLYAAGDSLSVLSREVPSTDASADALDEFFSKRLLPLINIVEKIGDEAISLEESFLINP